MHYPSWCALTDDELVQRGLPMVNLAAAFGLRPCGEIDVHDFCRRVDRWAEVVDYGISRAFKRSIRNQHRGHTDNQFRILTMVTVLWKTLGVRYNWSFAHGDYDASDSRNHFIHGLLTGCGGTCVTMPVLYAAIGRRLGFPLKLVHAKTHGFCRWDDGRGERFNIEGTNFGLNIHSDEHYRKWPHPITDDEIERRQFLYNLTPREELASFVAERGHCLTDRFQTERAVEAFYYANQLAPDHDGYHLHWGVAIQMHRTVEFLKSFPPGMPITADMPLPEARDRYEARFLPLVRESILRIANRNAKKDRALRDLCFQQFA
jgi:hypothetical protein